eukprot:1942391-Alexandrium_andersonii.AAC.1
MKRSPQVHAVSCALGGGRAPELSRRALLREFLVASRPLPGFRAVSSGPCSFAQFPAASRTLFARRA